VLQHWYELRRQGEKLGTSNSERFAAVKSMNMIARRQGADALRGEVQRACRGLSLTQPVHYVLGGGLFTDQVEVETLVRRGLRHDQIKHRIAATYGAIYYISTSEEVASLLVERVVLEQEDALLVDAARDALSIGGMAKHGSRCTRCGQTGGPLSTRKLLDWMVVRGS
jgi:hypothetical protein